jgi:DmsE family decaheme c-type cytochrome
MNMTSRCRFFVTVTALGLGFAGLAIAQDATPTFVGDETCTTCHEDQMNTLAGTAHASPAFGKLATNGCESCHGPGSAHADDPDNEALRPTLARLNPSERSAVCQSCHDGGKQFFWQGSTHDNRNVACSDCHSVHAAKSDKALLVAGSTMEQCFSCHKNIRAELWKNSHHPIREGKVSCADCHNPHGTQTAKMVIGESVNELCYNCHTEKRGPFLWEHAPVRENCLTCHTPHGSNHIKLQKTSVPYLCQQCHSNTRHPGTLYDNTRLPSPDNPATGSNRIFNRACLDCHATIHGSNHPSSPYLGY